MRILVRKPSDHIALPLCTALSACSVFSRLGGFPSDPVVGRCTILFMMAPDIVDYVVLSNVRAQFSFLTDWTIVPRQFPVLNFLYRSNLSSSSVKNASSLSFPHVSILLQVPVPSSQPPISFAYLSKYLSNPSYFTFSNLLQVVDTVYHVGGPPLDPTTMVSGTSPSAAH